MLEACIRHSRGTFSLDASFSAGAGRLTVLLGENGAGKTTLLRALAGLEHPEDGSVRLGGSTLFDTQQGFWPAAETRPVALLSPALPLFPHLDVRGNVAFGLAHLPTATRSKRVNAVLHRFGLEALATRAVGALSTGERQRVALARVWVREPALLLLDEPFSALDVPSRATFRSLIRSAVASRTGVTLLVSHDPHDALALADDVIVLEQGRVTQSGDLERVLRAPASPYIARFLGVNLFEGRCEGAAHEGLVDVRLSRVGGSPGALVQLPDPGHTDRLRIVLHPREVLLSRDSPTGSARNHLHGAVLEMTPEPPSGDTLRVTVASEPPITAQITRAAATELALAPGVSVVATFKATAPEISVQG